MLALRTQADCILRIAPPRPANVSFEGVEVTSTTNSSRFLCRGAAGFDTRGLILLGFGNDERYFCKFEEFGAMAGTDEETKCQVGLRGFCGCVYICEGVALSVL